ncbi:biotin/lipoyl-containing protein [Coraliomargarita akajimensis]|uniref:Biotin/lipoyl attachment domain-containing protein n=1 Tax=Coraliomargarita akajimensis (strain DSM 45221 / IAM 15411 / JCM 23193 / KCTC 12865 / 04OKA010-24) TaxID=583355 RepID=D5EQ53_CORAD|nr:biotin/lipoyl-containing protein [Coraliomargarita akajimensis]ADE53821.1 biotin/lipoyl attachment domain-containing protein [Coraliomargarita akajimensis DSM 45221]
MKRLRITVEGKSYEVEVELLDEGFTAAAPAAPRPASSARVSAPVATPKPAAPKPAAAPAGGAGDVPSPLAAVVVSVDVAVGDTVEEGQKVITLEAMKMNTIVSAPVAGTVSAINVAAGDAVEEGQSLVTIG